MESLERLITLASERPWGFWSVICAAVVLRYALGDLSGLVGLLT